MKNYSLIIQDKKSTPIPSVKVLLKDFLLRPPNIIN